MAAFTVVPSGQACGARIVGIDLRSHPGDTTIAELRQAWLEHHVIAFPDQDLSIEDLEHIATWFGPYGEDPFVRSIEGHPHVIAVKRNADETTPIFAEAWHSDWSFLPQPPAGTLLYGVEIPPVGGDTLYANQHLAFEALAPEHKRRLSSLNGIHSARRGYSKAGQYGDKDVGRSMAIVSSDDAMVTQLHPLVRAHTETGRPSLFCSMGYTIGIDQMDPDEAQHALVDLYHHCIKDEFIYRHEWSAGMLTLWDNRCLLHRATGGYDGHRRLLHRITIGERVGREPSLASTG
jgi:taurine dioxygenase